MPSPFSRRRFLLGTTALSALTLLPRRLHAAYTQVRNRLVRPKSTLPVTLRINGQPRSFPALDTRTTLLDLLREQAGLPGTKKGCDHGQCGACTIHLNGERVLSCLTLAVMAQNQDITTIEGLAKDGQLHPMQEAFISCDGMQCGYCTPGQIMSAVACVKEGHTGSVEEIKEFMSGNICRCGAYNGIVAAIQQAAKTTAAL